MDPYRTRADDSTRCDESPQEETWASGELVIAAMLGVVGALGVAAGIVGHGTWELSIGSLLVLLGAKVANDERRARAARS